MLCTVQDILIVQPRIGWGEVGGGCRGELTTCWGGVAHVGLAIYPGGGNNNMFSAIVV